MLKRRITLVVSDLHIGDGGPGDDFVDDARQFARLVREQADTPEGRVGEIELIVNGDFLELVQVQPDLYQGDFDQFWASEMESLARVERVVAGHPEVFSALSEFAVRGNGVTLYPGNHDVDLVWPRVQERLRSLIHSVRIETDRVTYDRYGGRLQVSHGHLFEIVDPANMFTTFPRLILDGSDPHRLPMCPGTLFMLRFVNLMEAKYPFADNVSPVTALIGIFAREDKFGLASLAWLFSRFMVQFPQAFLSAAEAKNVPIGKQLLNAIQSDHYLRADIARLYGDVLGALGKNEADVKRELDSEEAVASLLEALFRADPTLERWISVFDSAKPDTLSVSQLGGDLLKITTSGQTDAREGCITIARGLWNAGAQVVVLGHTHLPQSIGSGDRRYYNPGSWTRYVENADGLSLKDLQDETKFPYQLNYVRVEDTGDKILLSDMITYEKRS